MFEMTNNLLMQYLAILGGCKDNPASMSEHERQMLQNFQGFGNYKEILNPINPLFQRGGDGESLLRSIYPDRHAEVLRQLKASTLSSFFTPPAVVNALAQSLREVFTTYGIRPRTFLDPSAGTGAFLNVAPPDCTKMLVEKDIVTADLLQLLTFRDPTVKVLNAPFETICPALNGTAIKESFDLIASNIPFGNYSVYDSAFQKRGGIYRQSMKRIHTYYFTKSLDLLADKGILAFITTRAICDTADLQPLRQHIADQADLLSAIRLPDNLFKCGVGTDLLIFRKDESKTQLSKRDNIFINSQLFPTELTAETEGHALATEIKPGTDPYGRPAIRYLWKSSKAV